MNEAPCEHWGSLTGTISAGNPDGKFHSVVTCDNCKIASAGYVQMRTGLPANPFEPFQGGE